MEPTCTETGLTAGKKCSVCETVTVKQNIIPANGHDEIDIPGINATYTETGLTVGKKCSVCHTVTVEQKIIPVLKGSEGLTFSLNNDNSSYTVTGIGTCTDANIIIPQKYDNLPVTGIGDNAFNGCSGLTSITIPNSVTSIGGGAFGYCSGLTSVTIPSSVTSIGGGAFYNCNSLTSITISGSITSIGVNTFYNCSSLTSISIPSSVTSIGDYAFSDCSSLECITIPNGVIGNSAFSGCTDLTSVTIGNGVTSIDYQAFFGCSGLTNITIPSSVTYIGVGAFKGCSGLTSITLPFVGVSLHDTYYTNFGCIFGASSYGYNASFVPTSLRTVVITGGNSIDETAFFECMYLTSITIPSSVTSIGKHAFYNCYGLSSVTFENTDGWYIVEDSSATSGTAMDVTNTDTNATNLKSTYCDYYWKRNA